jgi:hypothetical protein
MVDCCANPSYRAEFKMFHRGDLYALERSAVDTGSFWLGSECAPKLDLVLNADGRLFFRPQSDRRHTRPIDPDAKLRLISHANSTPWRNAIPLDEFWVTQNFHDRGELAN